MEKKNYKKEYIDFVLGGDIGGTNTNIGVSGIKNNRPVLLFSLHFKSQKLYSLIPAINETLEYAQDNHKIEITNACFGVAGPISIIHDFSKLTNVKWQVDAKEILDKTPLSSVFIVNDLEAVGYGINLLDIKNKKDIFNIKNKLNLQKELLKATKAIIGAGTGLGKSILVYEDYYGAHIPIPSEGGHGDFPVQNEFELELLNFIKNYRKIKQSISYEEVISGRGIEAIYLFLKNSGKFKITRYIEEIDKSEDKPALISTYKNKDETCRETFKLYARFYARCAKNFVLDSLSRGGLYIAGGIASKNKEIFQTKEFMDEFENSHKQSKILKNIPIYIIVNYNVGMYGAGFAAMIRKNLAIRK